jgi:pyridoxine 5-phosphate synthase
MTSSNETAPSPLSFTGNTERPNMIHLGVNIDHVATLRNARGGHEPSILQAAALAAQGGADSITIHLREDRRHIVDQDVQDLVKHLDIPINLEMSVAEDIAQMALDMAPPQVTLVPEKREEKTTEEGLDVIRNLKTIGPLSEQLRGKGTKVCLFMDPDLNQLQACLKTASRTVELHTGAYALAKDAYAKKKETKRLEQAALWCLDHGFTLHAGHGLNYHNTSDLLYLPGLKELNIGHSIISRAIFSGLEQAVRDMKNLIEHANHHSIFEKSQALISDHKAKS